MQDYETRPRWKIKHFQLLSKGLPQIKPMTPTQIIDEMTERGTQIVISQCPQRKHPLDIDLDVYKWWHLVENVFAKIKEFKAIAMRTAKTGRNFSAVIYLCSGVINSK